MAKQVQLKQNGADIYPQTITNAIADTTKGKLLSTIITELYSGITEETNNRIAAINALDYTGTSAVTGQYVKTITETDGIIAATFGKVAASEVSNNGAEGSAIADDETVQDALDTLAAKAAAQELVAKDKSVVVAPIASGADAGKTGINVNIKSGEKVLLLDANDGLYTDIKLSAVTPSSTTVKEEWALMASDGKTQLGSTIKVYKDQSLKSIVKNGETIVFTYILADGSESAVTIDLEEFVIESEFGNGLQVSAHTVSVKKDAASEGFLSVSADGVKISGVQDAIDGAVNALDATVSGQNNSVKITVVEGEGKLTSATVEVTDAVVTFANSALTISGNSTDIVTKAGAEAIKSYVDAKTGALDSKVSGQTANGFIKVEVNQADGALDYVKVTGTTQAVASADASNKGLAEASDVKDYVDSQINALNADKSGQTSDTFITVQVVEQSGKTSSVVVTDKTQAVASADASNKGLAEASDVKTYVDGEIGKTAIKASDDITPGTPAADGTPLSINFASAINGTDNLAVKNSTLFAWGVTTDPAKDKAIADFTWPTA